MLLPGFVDEILYKEQLIPHDGSYDQTKENYRVTNDRIVPSDPDFSTIIRQGKQ